jgi:hypothetical protein
MTMGHRPCGGESILKRISFGLIEVGRSIFSATPQCGNSGYELSLHFHGAPDVSSVS